MGAIFAGAIAQAGGKCKVNQLALLPITMDNLQPTFPVQINGKDAQFILDSGAFYSSITSATAAEYQLKLYPAPMGLYVKGIGGAADVSVARIKEFTIVGAKIKNLEFLVGGSEVGHAGLMGQNLLSHWDVEYDLGKGVIKLFQTDGCSNTLMAYWLQPQQPYSVMPVEPVEKYNPHTVGTLYINGRRIRAVFDTGAATSMLTLKAAARAGVTVESPGVVPSGFSRGIGRRMVKTYIAPFSSFKVGDGEEIQNAKLRIADTDLGGDEDMLLGADFFLSHHVFVANKEHKIFLSYNGGPVFDLSKRILAAEAGEEEAPEDKPAVASAAPDAPAAEPSGLGAAELARRGEASASRHDFAAAVTDLSKAIALDPNNPQYFFDRAHAYWNSGKGDAALTDFDHCLQLKEDFLAAYIPRAELKLGKKDESGAIADLNKLDQMAASQADVRLELARMFMRVDRLAAAVDQFDVWMKNHPDDSRLVSAAASRCELSGLLNQDLDRAMTACNLALRRINTREAHAAVVYTYRGIVRWRRSEYPGAMEDFNAALKLDAKHAAALYGRGVTEARLNKGAASDSDLSAASQIAPQLAKRMVRYGIAP
jgi:tetratricopeptide (TPR) repeat protein